MPTFLRSTRVRAALITASAAAVVAGPLALPASAGIQYPMPLFGEVECNQELGMNGILWELQNNTGENVTIESAVLFGAIEGDENSWTVDPIPADVSSFAHTIVQAGVTGTVSLAVHTSWVDGEFPMEADSVAQVDVEACEGPTTTTTSTTAPSTTTTAPTTTTTAPAPAVVAVVATPHFTG